jgi:hypothetical protein
MGQERLLYLWISVPLNAVGDLRRLSFICLDTSAKTPNDSPYRTVCVPMGVLALNASYPLQFRV